jgi:hypothetical protein
MDETRANEREKQKSNINVARTASNIEISL